MHHYLPIFLLVTYFCTSQLVTTVWKIQKFTLPLFWQKFRESIIITTEIIKWLIWRNLFSSRVNFSFFHTVVMLFAWQQVTKTQHCIKGCSNAGDSRFCDCRDYSSESTIVIGRPENRNSIISKFKKLQKHPSMIKRIFEFRNCHTYIVVWYALFISIFWSALVYIFGEIKRWDDLARRIVLSEE